MKYVFFIFIKYSLYFKNTVPFKKTNHAINQNKHLYGRCVVFYNKKHVIFIF